MSHYRNILTAAPPPSGLNLHISSQFGAVLASLVLIFILRGIGRSIPQWVKVDDVGRVIIGLFGVVGALLTIPQLSGLRNKLYSLVVAMVGNSSRSHDGVNLLTVGLAALGVFLFWKRVSWKTLFWFVILTIPLFHFPQMVEISQWYVSHIGLPVFHALARLATALWHLVLRA